MTTRREATPWSEVEPGLSDYIERQALVDRILQAVRDIPTDSTVNDALDGLMDVKDLVARLDGTDQ